MSIDLERIKPLLEAHFRAHGVRLAYLFGSQVTGRTHAESDIDVAALLAADLTPDQRFQTRLELIGALMRVFGTDAVDVAILNDASPLLKYEVLAHGLLLYCPDPLERIEFQVRSLLEYEDTEPLRRRLWEATERRLRTGKFGRPINREEVLR